MKNTGNIEKECVINDVMDNEERNIKIICDKDKIIYITKTLKGN